MRLMNSSRKAYTAAVIMIAFLLALTGCGQGTGKETSGDSGKRKIRIGYLPITHAAPLYIEEELGKGKFNRFELELVKFGSWPDLMDALNTGNIDGASVLIELAMRAKEQGIDLKTVALGHKDGNVVVSSNDIMTVSDLKGKNFAIPHKFSTHNVLLYQMLKQHGMQYSDVKVVELPPAEMPAALSEKRIAGYVVAEPFGAKSVVIKKGKVLFQSEQLWKDSVDCGLVIRGDLIRKDREAVKEFVAEYVKAGQKAEQKDAQAKQILKKYMNVEDEVLGLSLEWIKYDDLKLDKASYEELREYMKEMKLSDNPPTFEEFVDNSFIEEALGKS
ncbi:MAG: NMT1-like family protein [Paenibacillus sp.]|uniref:ABC transporter substrate-binding protein n=1 Tax=unclassified Paenibacillus TaxID=185978 RepID=UPI0029EB623C|nr:NMT1-like family protein [Paenibacillus sp.]